MSGGRRQLPDTLTGQDVADYEAKRTTLLTLGRRHGVSPQTVRGWLVCRRVPIRPAGRGHLQPDMERIRRMAALFAEGHTQTAVGSVLGITGERVRQLRLKAERHGVLIPKPKHGGRRAKEPVLNGRQV